LECGAFPPLSFFLSLFAGWPMSPVAVDGQNTTKQEKKAAEKRRTPKFATSAE
jgi:hypothetical protein